ncbi:hypothetical protein A1T07_22610 (plasmid) [Lysinibacillus sphaericus]|nr:hypothetical protein A1T07_22610 [Lysinibacillus sphaericus]
MINRVVLVGRLTKDPELRYTPNGIAKKKVPGAFDYRDNLYAAKQYDYMAGTTNITGAYKPDGELLVEDQRFFIEVDTGASILLNSKLSSITYLIIYNH